MPRSENFRDALMKDLAPCHLMLSSSKHDVASALGNKVDEVEMQAYVKAGTIYFK